MDRNNYAGHPAFGMAAPPPYDGYQQIHHHQQQHPQQQQLPYDGNQKIYHQQQQLLYDGNQKIYHQKQQHPQQQQLPYDGYQQINHHYQQHPQRQQLPYDGYQQIYQQHPQRQQLPYDGYQKIYQQHPQKQQLPMFWADLCREIEQTTDFKNHRFPLFRIKKIMKADEDVRMIAAEAPVVFSRACELFILDLTYRAWCHAVENRRRAIWKRDVAAAITRTDLFDFMVDLVPREEAGDDVFSPPLEEDPLSCHYIQQNPS